MYRLFGGFAIATALMIVPALAEVTVKEAWVRATPAAAKVSAGYAVISNAGPADDVLTGVRTPVAGMVHLHSTTGADGVMRMESVPELTVPAGKDLALKPGDYHVMIMGLKTPLNVGEEIPLIFSFRHQGDVAVTARVQSLASGGYRE